jgi:cation transport regulator ChaC
MLNKFCLLYFILLTGTIVLNCNQNQQNNTPNKIVITLNNDEAIIFGYGSLISKKSMENTLGRIYDKNLYIATIKGWKRGWDIAMPNTGKNQKFYYFESKTKVYPDNILYLNIRKDDKLMVNGCLYIIKKDEIKLFDAREWIYDRVDITSQIENITIKNGSAWAYKGKIPYIMNTVKSTKVAAIRNSYINIVESGLKEMDKKFNDDYIKSTDKYPEQLVIDDKTE